MARGVLEVTNVADVQEVKAAVREDDARRSLGLPRALKLGC